jgi:hypothetical protein
MGVLPIRSDAETQRDGLLAALKPTSRVIHDPREANALYFTAASHNGRHGPSDP